MSKFHFFLIVIAVACLPQISSDIYAPAMPGIAHVFGTPIDRIQLSMVTFLLGLSSTILIYGPVSEGIGRKPPLMVGLSLMMVGTAVCMLAQNAMGLIVGRLIQGFGAGACSGLWRAMFRDMFHGAELSKYGGYLGLVVTFVMPSAPLLGSFIYKFFDWRAIFVFLLIYGVLTIIGTHFLYEDTSKHHHKDRLKFAFIMQQFKRLFMARTFAGIALCAFLSYGAFFTWFIVGPVILIHVLDITPVQFGWLSFIGGIVSYSVGGFVNARLVERVGMANMLRLGWLIMVLSGAVMAGLAFTMDNNVWIVFIPAMTFMFGGCLIWPNAFATAMSPFGDIAGYAGSAYSFMQMLGGSVVGAVASHLPDTTQMPLAGVLFVCPLVSWVVYEVLVLAEPRL